MSAKSLSEQLQKHISSPQAILSSSGLFWLGLQKSIIISSDTSNNIMLGFDKRKVGKYIQWNVMGTVSKLKNFFQAPLSSHIAFAS